MLLENLEVLIKTGKFSKSVSAFWSHPISLCDKKTSIKSLFTDKSAFVFIIVLEPKFRFNSSHKTGFRRHVICTTFIILLIFLWYFWKQALIFCNVSFCVSWKKVIQTWVNALIQFPFKCFWKTLLFKSMGFVRSLFYSPRLHSFDNK